MAQICLVSWFGFIPPLLQPPGLAWLIRLLSFTPSLCPEHITPYRVCLPCEDDNTRVTSEKERDVAWVYRQIRYYHQQHDKHQQEQSRRSCFIHLSVSFANTRPINSPSA